MHQFEHSVEALRDDWGVAFIMLGYCQTTAHQTLHPNLSHLANWAYPRYLALQTDLIDQQVLEQANFALAV